jgi:hypothetical protein
LKIIRIIQTSVLMPVMQMNGGDRSWAGRKGAGKCSEQTILRIRRITWLR